MKAQFFVDWFETRRAGRSTQWDDLSKAVLNFLSPENNAGRHFFSRSIFDFSRYTRNVVYFQT